MIKEAKKSIHGLRFDMHSKSESEVACVGIECNKRQIEVEC